MPALRFVVIPLPMLLWRDYSVLACVAGGIVWVRDESFGGGAVFQKKGVGTSRGSQISLDYIMTAPPPNLTPLRHNTASYAGYSVQKCYRKEL